MDYPGKVITKTQVTPTQTSASGNWTLDDQAAAIKNNNWPVALVPNPISKSLRFNSADTAYLTRTFSSGNRKTWTWSAWVKRSGLGTEQFLFANYNATVGGAAGIRFEPDNTLLFYNFVGAFQVQRATSQVFRDTSAWYHIVAVLDTTQATAANRAKLYINGVQVTAFSATTDPTQNYDGVINYNDQHEIGALFVSSASSLFNGYLTEINFIDGQALTPSSFGMTNPQTGQWIPLKYSGTYGTNGFYLNFKDATSTTTLGYDYSGNANNWTTNNFSVTAGAGNDSLTDVPTPWTAYNTTGDVGGIIRGNYATFNPLAKAANATLSNGNLDYTNNSSTPCACPATIAVNSGKWYWEVTTSGNGFEHGLGLAEANWLTGSYTSQNFARYVTYDGTKRIGTASRTSYDASGACTAGTVLGFAADLDNGTLVVYRNGTSKGTLHSWTPSGTYYVPHADYATTASGTEVYNFGQRPFAYTPPTGFRSLCTTNLPATAIGFGLTNQGGKYFNPVLYTGTGAARSVTGVGFQPGFVWIKGRSTSSSHHLFDAVRGVPKVLFTDGTYAEETRTNSFTSFDSDGFTVGNSSDGNTNVNTTTYVAWNWKAAETLSKTYAVTVVSSGGNKYRFDGFAANAVTLELSEGGTFRFDQSDASNSGHPFRFSTTSDGTHGGGVAYTTGVTVVGTPGTSGAYTEITVAASAPTLYYYCTVHSGMGGQANTPTTNSFSNLTGTIQSNISPNTTAGFSIVTYTGTGATATVGHGLGAVPGMIIAKRRSAAQNWGVAHSALTGTQTLYLDLTQGAATGVWNGTPTSTVFNLTTDGVVNTNGSTYVAYCFAAVPGYSAFGSYTGNGSADGPFVYLGFRPEFVLTKRTDGGGDNWTLHDAARSPYNVASENLRPNTSGAEGSYPMDFLSNGFKWRQGGGDGNESGASYIYACFAEAPFQFANAR